MTLVDFYHDMILDNIIENQKGKLIMMNIRNVNCK